MSSPNFGPAGLSAKGDELAQALAAAGVIWASVQGYPFPDDEAWMVDRLKNVIKGNEIVDWSEPDFFEEAFVRHTSSALLASAWREAMQEYQWSFRLKMAVQPSRAAWYFRQLSVSACQIIGTFLHVDAPSTYVDWSWPVRIGFMQDARLAGMDDELRRWIVKEKSWLEPLIQFVDVDKDEPVVDFLFFANGISVLTTLRNALTSVRANCLCLLGASLDDWVRLARPAQESGGDRLGGPVPVSLTLTQAKGAVIAPFGAEDFCSWFTELIRELSHNVSLDLAVKWSSERRGNSALLASSRILVDATRLSVVADRLSRQLHRAGPPELEVSETMSRHLEMPPGKYRPQDIGSQLKRNLENFKFRNESDEATTISRISRDAGPIEPLMEFGEEIPESRALQHQLSSEDHPFFHRRPWPDEPLEAGFSYNLSLRIGPPKANWRDLNEPFPDDELPSFEDGHLLTIVFSEPFFVPQPIISTVFLPARGPSSTCQFHFSVSSERQVFEGRVIVLHENRVLQSSLLRAPVQDHSRPSVRPAAGKRSKEHDVLEEGEFPNGITFVAETAVHSFSNLKGRQNFATTVLLNKSSDGEARATRIAGYRASLISLKGLEKSIDAIKCILDKCDWETLSYDRLDARETLELLSKLAIHGRFLYDALVDDQQLHDRLRLEPRIQVVAARVDAHLPIEFCYSQTPPKTTARICPNAVKALKEGKCDLCRATKDGLDEIICPLAFWGLSKIIEWHRYDVRDRIAMENADFALQSEPTARVSKLAPLKNLLMGTSVRIPANEVSTLQRSVHLMRNAQPRLATTWQEWTDAIQKYGPATLLLMVHTELLQNLPSIEIGRKLLDPPYVDLKHVRRQGSAPPLVLLLGCGTGVSEVAFQSLPAQFRRKGAAIVVSTMAELLNVHAPRLAAIILAELGKSPRKRRTFGEVMLAAKRTCMIQGLPIALALLAYGDADWWV